MEKPIRKWTFCSFGILIGILSSSLATAQSRKILIPEPQSSILLGQGYFAETDEPRAPCVEGKTFYFNRPESSLHFDVSLSQQEINEEISAQFAGGINIGIASAKLTNTLLSKIREDDYHRTLVFKAHFITTEEVLTEVKLNSLGKRLLEIGDQETSIANCGREYVESIQHGGQIYITVQFKFDNKNLKNDLTTRAEFELLGLKKVKTFAKTMEKYKSAVEVQIDAFQVGGEPEELKAILDGLPKSKCTLEKIEVCDKIIQSLIDYASDPEQFAAQLRQSPITYTTAAYKNRGLSQLVATASPYLTAEDEEAHRELGLTYTRQKKIAQTILDLIASPLVGKQQRQLLYFAQQANDTNLEIVNEAIKECESARGVCRTKQAESQLSLKEVEPSLLAAWRSFYYYCQLKDPDEAEGVQAVLNQLHLNRCDKAETEISRITELSLKNLRLKKISFLQNFVNLKRLDVSDNELSDLSALGSLTQLRELRAVRNQIHSLDGLEQLRQLERLSVSHNQIQSLAPLADLSKLRFVGAFNNLLQKDPGPDFLPQAKKLLNSKDACTYESQKLIEQTGIDTETATLYQELDFGPYFQADKPLQWINCDLASTYYND